MQDVHDMVTNVARRYAARCWWAELDDLVQEGWVAVMEASRTWRPPSGPSDPMNAGLACYAQTAVMRRLRRHLYRMSAPVTGPWSHGEKVAGLVRAPVEKARVESDPEAAMTSERWWAELGHHMEAVIAKADASGVAARVLLRGDEDRDVAAELGLALAEVRARANAARRLLRADSKLPGSALRELVAVGT